MSKVILRGYQNDCIQGVREAFTRGKKRVTCVLPTGSGKTTIFGQMCSSYAQRNPKKRAAIISHLGLLTKQTGDRFKEDYGIISEVLQAGRLPSQKAQTIVTTMQSFRSKEKLLRWASKLSFGAGTLERLNIGLLIIDECHLVGNDSYQTILDMFPNAYVIGFTATPFRQNKLMTNMFEEVAYTISAQELIDQGFLVPPALKRVKFNVFDQAEMFSNIIKIYNEYHKGHKAVVYLKTIAEAELLRNVLIESGINCSAITSKLKGKKRDEILKDYREGNGPDILTTVDVLTAGFDSPNLRCIFMPYKVGSVTTYLQRVGRGLRPYVGKAECDVYVNTTAPKIEEGFWERITREMLDKGGRKKEDYEDYLELLKDGKELCTEEEISWTMDVVNMAKEVRGKGMENLYLKIIHKDFPKEMLQAFIDHPPTTPNSSHKPKPTDKQLGYLEKHKINAEGLSKYECIGIIEAHMRSLGWVPPQDEIVPSGKHKGKHFSKVPRMYWKIISKRPSDLYKSYRNYKEKIDAKRTK
jgi:superfamily II DNA or RNA helicase